MPRTPLFITNHMVDTYENTFRLVERFLLRGKRKREKEKEKKKKVKKKKEKRKEKEKRKQSSTTRYLLRGYHQKKKPANAYQ